MQTFTAGYSSTKPMVETTIVTASDVENAFNKKEKIQLIKLYRQKFNTGLKDSKDAIETVLPCIGHIGQLYDTPQYTKENLQKMLTLFFPNPNNENDNLLFFAISTMKENWRHLGYKSFKDGVLAIMSNF